MIVGCDGKETVPTEGYHKPLGARGEGLIDAPITLPDHWDGPVIYKVLDWSGDLLYVGSTVNLRARVSGHKKRPWRDRAAKVTWVRVPYSHLRILEANLIAKLRPPANIIYNPDVVNPNVARAMARAAEAQARFDRIAERGAA